MIRPNPVHQVSSPNNPPRPTNPATEAAIQVKPGPTRRAREIKPEARASPPAHATKMNCGWARVVRSAGTAAHHMAVGQTHATLFPELDRSAMREGALLGEGVDHCLAPGAFHHNRGADREFQESGQRIAGGLSPPVLDQHHESRFPVKEV